MGLCSNETKKGLKHDEETQEHDIEGKIDSLIDMLQHSNWAVWFLIQGSRLHRASGCLVHDDEGASNTEKAMTEVPFAKNAFHCSPMLCPCLICLSAPGLSIVLLL